MALEHSKWKGKTGGTSWMQRFLISYLRHFSLRSLYCIMACVAPFYMIFNRKGYLSIYHYFHERLGLNPILAFFWTWKNHYRFGQIILDRFAIYAGKKFTIEKKVGCEEFEQLCEKEEGMILLSAHIGNFELTGYSLNAAGKNIHALVFGGETATVMSNRNEAFGKNGVSMIPVKEDMSHIFTINDALVNGDIVSMPGDRLFGSSKSLKGRLLWGDADFPAGPFTVAAQRNLPVFALFAMKDSLSRYSIYAFRLDDEESRNAGRRERPVLLLKKYTRYLEQMLLKYPAQWFNYFEFWDRDLKQRQDNLEN